MATLNPQAPEFVSADSNLLNKLIPVLPYSPQASEFVSPCFPLPNNLFPVSTQCPSQATHFVSSDLPINPLPILPYHPSEAPQFNALSIPPYRLPDPIYFFPPSHPFFWEFPFMEIPSFPNHRNYYSYFKLTSLSWQFNSSSASSPPPPPAPVVPALPYMTKTEQAEAENKVCGGKVRPRVGGKGFKSRSYSKSGIRKEGIQVHNSQEKQTRKLKSVGEKNPYCRSVHPTVELKPVELEGTKTTLMIRNIPNKFSRQMLLDKLDEHCKEENQKQELKRTAEMAGDHSSAIDFVYLPMDFGSRCNKGYAFVNFTNARAAWKLHLSWHNKKWDTLGSKKISEITYARIQGKDELIKHFQSSTFACDSEEFLPVYFIPPRDGSGGSVLPCTVGKRIYPYWETCNRKHNNY